MALHDDGGCGQALLYLNDPATGHFQAALAVSDDATDASTVLRLFLLAPGGVLVTIKQRFIRHIERVFLLTGGN